MLDPNPDIRGTGVQRLRDAMVITDFFESGVMLQLEELNRDFVRAQRQQRPPLIPSTPQGHQWKRAAADGARKLPHLRRNEACAAQLESGATAKKDRTPTYFLMARYLVHRMEYGKTIGMTEGTPHAFYVTDSKRVAVTLRKLFVKDPGDDECHSPGKYSVVSEAGMSLERRTRAHSQLDKVLACVKGESGTSAIDDLMSRLRLLSQDYRRAADWEPRIRKELVTAPRKRAPTRREPVAIAHREPVAHRLPLTSARNQKHERRFAVALSFPGERRDFVEAVAAQLAKRVGRKRILYDKYHEAEFAKPDLDTHLQHLYHDESELIAVFLCAHYKQKEWCGLEWRAIRDLIKKGETSAIMFFRFDKAEIPGLFSIDGAVWIGGRSPQEIAGLVLKRKEARNAEGDDQAADPSGSKGDTTGNLTEAILSDIEAFERFSREQGGRSWLTDKGETRQLLLRLARWAERMQLDSRPFTNLAGLVHDGPRPASRRDVAEIAGVRWGEAEGLIGRMRSWLQG